MVELKFNPGFRVIGEYLSQIYSQILSQFDLNYFPITQNPWLNF